MSFSHLPALIVFAMPLAAQNDWDEPFPPRRIADNLYYVGSKGLSSYLVTSPQGHMLISASFDRTDGPNVWVDPEGHKSFIAGREKDYLDTLKKQSQ